MTPPSKIKNIFSVSHSTKTLARGVTASKSAQEIHLWLGVAARTICRLMRKRQTWRPFFFFFFLKYLNVFYFEDISRRDLVHFKRYVSSLWRADYWAITHFPWRRETVQEVFQSVEEWESLKLRLLHLDAMRAEREGRGLLWGEEEGWGNVQMTDGILVWKLFDRFCPSLPACLSYLPVSPSFSPWDKGLKQPGRRGEERRWERDHHFTFSKTELFQLEKEKMKACPHLDSVSLQLWV